MSQMKSWSEEYTNWVWFIFTCAAVGEHVDSSDEWNCSNNTFEMFLQSSSIISCKHSSFYFMYNSLIIYGVSTLFIVSRDFLRLTPSPVISWGHWNQDGVLLSVHAAPLTETLRTFFSLIRWTWFKRSINSSRTLWDVPTMQCDDVSMMKQHEIAANVLRAHANVSLALVIGTCVGFLLQLSFWSVQYGQRLDAHRHWGCWSNCFRPVSVPCYCL